MIEPLEDRSMLTAASINISSSVNEGGTAFGAITLDEPSDDDVYVSWTTSDGTANAGSDYYAASGTSVFAPGETYDSFAVSTINDSVQEGEEYFSGKEKVSGTIVKPGKEKVGKRKGVRNHC